ncbi:unnamed protein product [Penicillium nalgiovense]|uniref:Uncharacterized protein n=1 Tax=Penicillium nalgiovense TaxID=60175 RepID=A0A9W4HBU4_PENNA|nr:unnamed protein product [Penicillium nalgiovense]CAG7954857.1 unnamed protein product [Penicillium nalgiovense]CAG7957604.1 unnamed protein product [Penicillium nalgiovense]CAG7961755.1 unnamed protein product [Penicillium nalgiovense]CAG7967552.1 unnamed protein product [Penicillium nalgiovense]
MGNRTTPIGSIARNIAAIPTELAHQIIDDLRVWDVLKLMCYDNDRVDACIMSHSICRSMFGADPETFAKWKFAARLYKDIFTAMEKAFVPERFDWVLADYLGKNIHCPMPQKYGGLLTHMKNRIYDQLNGHWCKTDLTRFGAPNYSNGNGYLKKDYSFEQLKECWHDIQKAKANLFQLRASELRWTADMLEANPDILKRTLDPAQEFRPNTAHIVSRLRRTADAIMRNPAVFSFSEHFRYDFLNIIPFDSALDQLLHMMQKHGIIEGDQLVAGKTIASAGAASHPSSIINSVRIVIDGMPKFYISPPETAAQKAGFAWRNAVNKDGDLLRTANTPWSEPCGASEGVSLEGPYFTAFKYGNDKSYLRPEVLYWDPHHEMEKEWLASFVEVYRYLKNLDS